MIITPEQELAHRKDVRELEGILDDMDVRYVRLRENEQLLQDQAIQALEDEEHGSI